MSKLTKREKALLLLLAVIGMVAGAVFLAIIPLYNHLTDLEAEHLDLLARQEDMRLELSMEAATRAGYDNAAARLEETRLQYRLYMPNTEILQDLSDLRQRSRMTSQGARLAHTQGAIPYSADPRDRVSPEDAAVFVNTATLTLTGSYDSIQTFIDEVDRHEYLQINKIAFNAKDALEGSATNISIILEIMMLSESLRDVG